MSARSNSSRAARLVGWLSLTKTAGGSFGDVRSNPSSHSNPVEASPGKLELIAPAEEQIRAMIQGVYETKFTEQFGLPFYNKKGLRNDTQFAPHMLAPLKAAAFRIAKANAKKFDYLERSRISGHLVPTERAFEESYNRYLDPDALLDNRQAYEETLALTRKAGFYRVTSEPTKTGLRYFVWPMLKGQSAPRPYDSFVAAIEERNRRNRESDPRKTGRWWKMPTKRVTKKDLAHWLPPATAWRRYE